MKSKAACIQALEDGKTLCYCGDHEHGLVQYDEDGDQYDPIAKEKEKHMVGGDWVFHDPADWTIHHWE